MGTVGGACPQHEICLCQSVSLNIVDRNINMHIVQAFVIFVLMTAGFINACSSGDKKKGPTKADYAKAGKIIDCQLDCYSRFKSAK